MLIATVFLIGAAVVALAYMSRGAGAGVNEKLGGSLALVMIQQNYDFKLGLDRFVADGAHTAGQMTFDASPATGLFDTTPGLQTTVWHKPPASAVDSGTSLYAYNKQALLPGVGTNAGADFVVVAGNLTSFVCRHINAILYKDTLSDEPAVSAGTFSAWTDGLAVDDSVNPAINYTNRPEGCIRTVDNKYLYYKALVEN